MVESIFAVSFFIIIGVMLFVPMLIIISLIFCVILGIVALPFVLLTMLIKCIRKKT